MDGLSGAASVMAAVSLTIQLVGTVNTLRKFWLGIKGAPAEVQDIVDDLALLNGILSGVDRAYALHDDPNDHDPEHAKSIYLALLRCQNHVEKMKQFADNLRNGFAKKRYRTAFKTMLQKPKITEFTTHLEHAKSTLLMALNVTTLLLQNKCGRAVQAQFSSLRSDMLEFAMDVASSTSQLPATPPHLPLIRPPSYGEQKGQNESSDILWSKSNRIAASDILLWLLKLPQDSPYRKSLGEYGRLVGTVSWQSSGSLVNSSGGSERFLKNSVIISIEIPIVRRAFTMRSQQHFGQWTHSFRVSRILPDDSPIFKICATKDTTAVRKLFESGMASPFDQTASGITLLHAAAAGYRCQTYKLLCDAGVEYGLCEDSFYGKLAPIELTQSMTVFLEGKRQTVRKWLGIHEEQDQSLLPERNFDCVARIWKHSLEIRDQMSDAEILTMLQGPLQSAWETGRLLRLGEKATSINQAMTRYSSTHMLFCYFLLFRRDPYGCRITKATIFFPSLKCQKPFYEYLEQYWNRAEWLEIFRKFPEIDFRKLGQRQQDKHSLHSPNSIWEVGPRNKKIARMSSSFDIYLNMWYSPVNDWEVVFEFEGEFESTNTVIEDPIESPSEPEHQVIMHPEPKPALRNKRKPAMSGVIKNLNLPACLYGTVFSITLHFILYFYFLQTSGFRK